MEQLAAFAPETPDFRDLGDAKNTKADAPFTQIGASKPERVRSDRSLARDR
jgi:hypothetical protein